MNADPEPAPGELALEPPKSNQSEPWGASCRRAILGLAAAAFGLTISLLISSFVKLSYIPYDGVVGMPAFLNYAPSAKIFGYLLYTIVPAFALLAALKWEGASLRPRRAWTLAFLLSAASIVLVLLFRERLPPGVRSLLSQLRRDPSSLLTVGLVFLAGLGLGLPPTRRLKEESDAAKISFVAATIFLWIWAVATPGLGWKTALALGSFGTLISRPWMDRKVKNFNSGKISGYLIQAGLFGAPLVVIVNRIYLTFRTPVPPFSEPEVVRLLTVAAVLSAPLLFAFLSASGRSTALFPIFAVVLAVLFRGAGVASADYDPYHQAEFAYPGYALGSLGLLPHRDTFLVHGEGFNLILGLLFNYQIRQAPNFDMLFLGLLGMLMVFLFCWFLLSIWGAAWWPMVAAVSLLAIAPTPKAARLLPLFLLLFSLFLYERSGKPAFLAVTGAIAWLCLAFSLDIGIVAFISVAILHFFAKGNKLYIFEALTLGFLVPFVGHWTLLAVFGILDDFISVNLSYANIKAHYDNLPFPDVGLIYFLAPLLSMLGVGVIARWKQINNGIPLAMIFLTIANYLLYFRGLDRSDPGHLAYGSLLAWPLLGFLVVWRARLASEPEKLARATVVAGLMVALPLLNRVIAAPEPPIIQARNLFSWYATHSDKPAQFPREKMTDPFFTLAEEIESEADGYLWDMTNQPALYFWTSLRCPTRYYSTFYPASERWQDEVIERMEQTETEWVLWPSPAQEYFRVDQIDFRLRLWKLATHIRRNYRPWRQMSDGSILLRAHPPDGEDEARDTSVPTTSEVDLGQVSLLWGLYPNGGPDPTSNTIWESEWLELQDEEELIPVPGLSSSAIDEIQIEVGQLPQGSLQLIFQPETGIPNLKLGMSHEFAGPYRVPVAPFVGWEASIPIRAVRIKHTGPVGGQIELKLRFFKD